MAEKKLIMLEAYEVCRHVKNTIKTRQLKRWLKLNHPDCIVRRTNCVSTDGKKTIFIAAFKREERT